MHEVIKSRLNLGNAFYHSVQNYFSSCPLSKNIKVKIYKTIILPVVLYGCETWCSHSVRVFENRVLRRIFQSRMDDVMGEWRNLQSGELHNLYLLPDIIRQVELRRMTWVGHVATVGEESKMYDVFMGKPKGKRPLGIPRCRWEDGIGVVLLEIVCGGECEVDTSISVRTGDRLS
jgi:hypothetical protein